jgi:hypothetical protein
VWLTSSCVRHSTIQAGHCDSCCVSENAFETRFKTCSRQVRGQRHAHSYRAIWRFSRAVLPSWIGQKARKSELVEEEGVLDAAHEQNITR